MPELASQTTRPPQNSCPSAEDLACYIDGVLSPEEAARVEEHLASCESCFEVYSGVLQFQLEEEPAPGGELIPFPGKRQRPPVQWWSSIAAILVAGLGFGTYFYLHLLAPPSELMTAQLTAALHSKSETEVWRGEVHRGGSGEGQGEPSISMESAAFRTGVQIVNLQAKLQANDSDAVTGAVIPAALTALDGQPGATELESELTGITTAIGNHKALKDLLPEVSRLGTEARELDPLYFDLGQWVEAGRLAAISQDPAFFRRSENRSFLRHVLWRDRLGFKDSKLPAGSRQDLEQIYQIAGQDTLQPADFVTLQGHFKKILELNYPE